MSHADIDWPVHCSSDKTLLVEKVCEESSGREATSGRESALLLDCEEETKFCEELQFAPTKLRRASELVLILGSTHVSFRLAPFPTTDQ